MTEVIKIMTNELSACPDSDSALLLPNLEHPWVYGGPIDPSRQMIGLDNDMAWWFLAAFAPGDMRVARKMLNAVPQFFGDLARLGSLMGKDPVVLDWNLINQLRHRLVRGLWPTAYQLATSVTEGPASRASELIRRLTTAEQWRTK
jgi:hypothetical protein